MPYLNFNINRTVRPSLLSDWQEMIGFVHESGHDTMNVKPSV